MTGCHLLPRLPPMRGRSGYPMPPLVSSGLVIPGLSLASRSRCPMMRAASCRPDGIARGAHQRAGLRIEGLQLSEGAGEARRDSLDGRVDDDLDLIFPPEAEMLFQGGDRIKIGGRAEGSA